MANFDGNHAVQSVGKECIIAIVNVFYSSYVGEASGSGWTRVMYEAASRRDFGTAAALTKMGHVSIIEVRFTKAADLMPIIDLGSPSYMGDLPTTAIRYSLQGGDP